MKIGPAIRRLLPPKTERKVAGLYRSVFVDLQGVAECIAPRLPSSAHLLDVGGGDGELLNALFELRPDLRVTMVDVSESVGKFVDPRHQPKLTRLPRMFVEEHLRQSAASYDAALISDVLHHIPVSLRATFLRNVQQCLRPEGLLFVKDIEPGHVISHLSLFSDRYISGDKGVALISRQELPRLAASAFPKHRVRELGLISLNAPNYLLAFDFSGGVAANTEVGSKSEASQDDGTRSSADSPRVV